VSDQQQGPGWWLASDGKWYPPQGPATPPALYQPQAPQPAYGQPPTVVVQHQSGCLRGGLIAAAVFAALSVIGIVGCVAVLDEAGEQADEAINDASEPGVDGEADEIDDVEIVRCETGEFGFMDATLDVTNNSSGASDYVIDVVFENRAGSRQFGTAVAIVNSLAPDQTTTVEAGSLEEAPAGGNFTCTITGVSRFAS